MISGQNVKRLLICFNVHALRHKTLWACCSDDCIPEDIEPAIVYQLNLAMFVGASGSVLAIRTGTVSSDFLSGYRNACKWFRIAHFKPGHLVPFHIQADIFAHHLLLQLSVRPTAVLPLHACAHAHFTYLKAHSVHVSVGARQASFICLFSSREMYYLIMM